MNFLESLYSIENFGIYLFVVIGILVVLFLIILFFGKKDEKKRKEEEQKPEESVDAFKETTEPVSIEIPVVEPTTSISNIEEPEETPVIPAVENFEVPSKEEENVKEKEEKEFDFDALAAAISKELESIEGSSNIEKEEKAEEITPVFEKEAIEPILPKIEEKELNFPVFEESVVEKPEIKVEVSEKPQVQNIVKEEKRPMARPTVFSSVYVNRNVEEPKIMEEQKSVKEERQNIEEPQIAQEKVVPVAPKIELPKMMDLPKKK